jgi:hypothetical protein
VEHKATSYLIEGTLSLNLKSGKLVTQKMRKTFVESNLLIPQMPAVTKTLYIIMAALQTAVAILGHLVLQKKLQP